jgi:hypothetical protein
MKKVLLTAMSAAALFSFSSCDKAEKLLFQPFESPLNFEITIPVVNTTTAETSMGSTTVSYNLDNEIKNATNNMFDGSVVEKMYIKDVAITILDQTDADNSLGNFDYVKLNVATNGGTPVVFGPLNMPANSNTQASFTIANSPNIRPYFNGASVDFSLTGKANKVTTRTLRARVSATIRFDK